MVETGGFPGVPAPAVAAADGAGSREAAGIDTASGSAASMEALLCTGVPALVPRDSLHSRQAPRRDCPLARLPVRRRNSASGLS